MAESGTPPTSETKTKTKVYFGVALELAGKTIALEPKNAINELKTKGIEVELPPGERVYLGTVGNSLKKILGTLGVPDGDIDSFLDSEGKLKADALPDIAALKKATGLVLGAGLFVDQFHVKIPGTAATLPGGASKEKTSYTVGLSAEWLEDAGNLIDGLDLKLRGIYLKVSNEE
jgi:hypothetical protein